MCSAVRHTVKRGVVDGHPLLPNWGVERGWVVTKLTTFLFPLALPKTVELMCVHLAGEEQFASSPMGAPPRWGAFPART
jgi:hypothetical protein